MALLRSLQNMKYLPGPIDVARKADLRQMKNIHRKKVNKSVAWFHHDGNAIKFSLSDT